MEQCRKRKKVYICTKELVMRFIRDDVSGLSAQLAYYFLLAIFPFFIFAFTLIGYLPISTENALSFIEKIAPHKVMDLLRANVHGYLNVRRGWLLFISLLGTLWSASSGIHAIIAALNKAYNVPQERSYISARLMAILFTFAMVLAFLLTLLLPVFGKTIEVFASSYFNIPYTVLVGWRFLRWVVTFAFLIIIFALLYYFAPNRPLEWKKILIGAVFAAVGWLIVSYGFAYYVNHFTSFTLAYGSLGGVIILMIWFYLSAMIIILGGQLNAIIQLHEND
jgi:membrane protein